MLESSTIEAKELQNQIDKDFQEFSNMTDEANDLLQEKLMEIKEEFNSICKKYGFQEAYDFTEYVNDNI